jgi:type II secretory pathway pseudopilin PulG
MADMRRRAFTLIEILVVAGIIVLVIGITMAAFSASRRQAQRTMTESALQTIRVAIAAYTTDHGMMPLPIAVAGLGSTPDRPNPPTGGQLLVQALIAPAPAGEDNAPANLRPKRDGLDGPGFKMRPAVKVAGVWESQGRAYGPYLPTEKVRLSNPGEPLLMEILDAWDTPIDYQPERMPGATTAQNLFTQKYTLVSAGPDQKFGTPDDIRSMP